MVMNAVKTTNDYINEILLWCDVVSQCNEPSSDNGLTESEEEVRHNAIVALYFATAEYMNRKSYLN